MRRNTGFAIQRTDGISKYHQPCTFRAHFWTYKRSGIISLAQPGYAGNDNETTSQIILVAFLSPGRVHGGVGGGVKAGWEPKMLRYLWFSCHVKQVVTAVQCHPSGFSGLCWSYHLLQCQRSRPVFRGPVEILALYSGVPTWSSSGKTIKPQEVNRC